MRILFITSAHNSLSQRAQIELEDRGHQVLVQLATSDEAMIAATEGFHPELILAPMLKKAIPAAIFRRYTCLIVHPGIRGDRGPSSLDWAITDGHATWGVTLLQAIEEMDGGDIWHSHEFSVPPRPVAKSALYRNEVTDAAIRGILTSVERFEHGDFQPEPLDYARPDVRGELRPLMKQESRALDWTREGTASIARKIRAADSFPGVVDRIFGDEYLLFGAHEEDRLRGTPGEIIARRDGAICRATRDGAVWISHLKVRRPGVKTFKLPAAQVLGDRIAEVPESTLAVDEVARHRSFREIRYVEDGPVGWLHFDFYNGAMSTEQCQRLIEAYRLARSRPTKVIVFAGGRDFFSNGIHLNVIEAAPSPADESWENIVAIDDLALEILTTTSHRVISALRANAGAGGVMLALAADDVWARGGVVLNPHYKSMGGLYGSEYWTYSLPRRVGETMARELTDGCQPIGTAQAKRIGLVDDAFGPDLAGFEAEAARRARALAADPALAQFLDEKRARRRADEAKKPLSQHRAEELAQMRINFYGPDPAYHEARRRFVLKLAAAEAPLASVAATAARARASAG